MRPPYLAQIESPAPSLLIQHDQQQSQQCDYYLPGTEKPRYLTYIFMFNLLQSFIQIVYPGLCKYLVFC